MTTTLTSCQSAAREDDLQQHIEDTRLFWVWREGRAVKLAWNELTEQERADTLEAERRDYFCTMFEIY